jgi:hypothetical protein
MSNTYDKNLDDMEEMGDLFWYAAFLADAMGVTFEDLFEANIAKFRARYPDKYSDDSAKNRDLESEREAMGKLVKAVPGPDFYPEPLTVPCFSCFLDEQDRPAALTR